MKKYNKVFSFIIVLPFLIGLWVIIGLFYLSEESKSQSNKNLIPDDIDLVLTVNSKKIIKSFLSEILFQANLDQNTAELFLSNKKEDNNRLGADLTSEVVVFYDLWKGNSVQGMLFNISNEGDFKRYQTDEENTIKVSNSKYGVLINLNEKASEETLIHFSNVAKKIITSKKKGDQKDLSQAMVKLEYQGVDGQYLEDLNIDVNIKNNTLLINGKGKINKPTVYESSVVNVFELPTSKKYFHIQTSEIPDEAMKSLTSTFNKLGIEVPSIASMQLLLYGVTIDNIDGSTAILPQFDWILRFDEYFQIDSTLRNLDPYYKSAIDFENKKITVGNLAYYYTQISENEIYIGVTERPTYSTQMLKPNYSASGYPSVILEIEGQGFFAGFIKMMPQIKYSKQFLKDIDHFDIHSDQIGDSLVIKGNISLKEDRFMSLEMAKYWLLLSN